MLVARVKSVFWSKLRLGGLKLILAAYEAGGSIWIEEAFGRGISRDTIYRLDDLEELGLIRVEKRSLLNRARTYITLTDLGRKIGEHLKAIDDLAPSLEDAEGVE